MKSRRKQSVSNSTSATPTVSEPPKPTPPETSAVSALSRFTDAAIILAFITFFGYWGAFCYETAYFEYFNIPYYFISLNPTMVFFASVGWVFLGPLMVFVLIVMVVLTALEPVGKNIERNYPRSVKIVSISFAVLMLIFLAYQLITDHEFRKTWTVETIVISALIVGFLFSFGFLYKRYKENKEEIPWRFIALLVSGFLLVSYLEFRFLRTIGEERAKKAKGFPVYVLPPLPPEAPVAPNSPTTEVAVIRTSGDYLLTIPFNRGTKEFENKLIIVKMSDSKTPLSLALQNIGPLHKPGTTPPQP